MRLPDPEPAWSDSVRRAYEFDRLELFRSADLREGMEYRSRYMSRYSRVIELVCAHLPTGARIIDIAAAQGNFSVRLAELGYDVTWNDLLSDLIDYVAKKDDRGLVKFTPGNAFEVAAGQGFDAVLATEIIEHVAHPDDFIVQLASLVRPGGLIVMSTPNGATLANQIPGRKLPRWSDLPDPSVLERDQFKPDADGHLFLLYEDEIRRFAAAAGLEVVEFDYVSNPITVGRWGLGRIHALLGAKQVDAIEAASRHLPRSVRRRLMDVSTFVLKKGE